MKDNDGRELIGFEWAGTKYNPKTIKFLKITRLRFWNSTSELTGAKISFNCSENLHRFTSKAKRSVCSSRSLVTRNARTFFLACILSVINHYRDKHQLFISMGLSLHTPRHKLPSPWHNRRNTKSTIENTGTVLFFIKCYDRVI